MSTEHGNQQSVSISREQLLALVRGMIGGSVGREDDDHPLPPGPWDPVIRVALERVRVFGPQPEPWIVRGPGVPSRSRASVFGPWPELWRAVLSSLLARHPEISDAIGGGHSFGDEVALNPQPLPPRWAFLVSVAQAVIDRAGLLQEIAETTSRAGEQQGIIIVGGYTRRFVDDWCGNGFRVRWPFPGPPPHWFAHELSGIDFIVMATQFDQAAKETFTPALGQHMADVSAKFAEAGISKIR